MCETPEGATVYGQEKDNATVGLAKMNMILHNEIYADIRQGDTINDPQFKVDNNVLKTFDYIVANPPFSTKSWLKSAKSEDEYQRWGEGIKIGVPPEKNGDYAFLLHIVRSLKQTGCAACILPHGVLFRGNAEAQIRKYLAFDKKYIKGIIGLPANLFYGTGIPACIIVIDKSEAAVRKGIFMIDAKNGYIKDGSKNRLREQDIRRIVDVWNAQRDVPHYARFVSMDEIERNVFNLNIPRYVSAPDTEILQDIDAHLYGGLPKHDIEQLAMYWDVCPTLRNELFSTHSTRNGYCQLKCGKDEIRETIADNIDFCKQSEYFKNSFKTWSEKHYNQLYNLTLGFAPKNLIEQLGNSLLEVFSIDKSLVDAYNVYDCLMNYWGETMQDDCYMISAGDWSVQLYTPQPASKKKDDNKKKKEKKAATPEDVMCDLLPVTIVINEYFAEKRDLITAAEELLAQKESSLTELIEEQTDNYLDEDNFIDSKLSDTNVKKRIKALDKKVDAEEITVLQKYLDLRGDISLNKKLIKERKYDLLTALIVKYANLSADEIKKLVIEKKWFASLDKSLSDEMQRISQQLTSKVSDLAERYSQTLPEIDAEIADLEAKVVSHLKQMGF
jgi:type I restriction enzyme M protein